MYSLEEVKVEVPDGYLYFFIQVQVTQFYPQTLYSPEEPKDLEFHVIKIVGFDGQLADGCQMEDVEYNHEELCAAVWAAIDREESIMAA